MGEGPKKQQISAGLLAHVDAGKTTLLQLHPRSQNRGFIMLCVRKSVSGIPEQIGSIISIRGDGGKHRHRPNCES